jgi:hypothetical protein
MGWKDHLSWYTMFSFHRAKVKQDIYLQSSFQNNVWLVCINFVEEKKIFVNFLSNIGLLFSVKDEKNV